MTIDDREAMIAVAHAHAAAEGEGDIEATMATLDDDPVYELQPIGLVLRGRDAARKYYEHFFANFAPRLKGYDLRSEWVTDEGVGQEYVLHLNADDESKSRQPIIGILLFGADGKLSGERIYASDELIDMMFGPVLDRALPV
jgi:SnoaL-like domain